MTTTNDTIVDRILKLAVLEFKFSIFLINIFADTKGENK